MRVETISQINKLIAMLQGEVYSVDLKMRYLPSTLLIITVKLTEQDEEQWMEHFPETKGLERHSEPT